MKLRLYQSNLIINTRDAFRQSKTRVLSVAPCGAGKTIMFAYMCNEHIKKFEGGYVWFLVHRQELIDQTVECFQLNNLSLDKVMIGMVQTVSRHLDRYPKPSMIIFDEAHHSAAKTWMRIIEEYPDVPLIGLTATPCRLDGAPLGDIYQSMVIGPSADELIELGYLAPYEYYAPHINLEDAKWETKGSDYDMQSVEKVMDARCIYGDVIKYIDLNKKTIIYSPTIKFSQAIVDKINNKYGLNIAAHFDGNTSNKDRKDIINRFRRGEIKVLSNVDLIGEGFDVPDCDCCFLLRPTMSVSLYIQQSMRCMRPAPDKIAYVYDFVGNVYKHGMPTEKRDWSLTSSVKIRNKSDDKELIVRECKQCFRVYKGGNRICPYCGHDNGKTRKEIEQDAKMELERITALNKKQERREVGMAATLEQLIAIGKKRGYRNPVYWARQVLKGRNKRI